MRGEVEHQGIQILRVVVVAVVLEQQAPGILQQMAPRTVLQQSWVAEMVAIQMHRVLPNLDKLPHYHPEVEVVEQGQDRPASPT